LVIRVSREPAENTSTSPLGSAVAELEAEELAEGEELAELEELEEELLQPAAGSGEAAVQTPGENELPIFAVSVGLTGVRRYAQGLRALPEDLAIKAQDGHLPVG
jgi:hypothetical protein